MEEKRWARALLTKSVISLGFSGQKEMDVVLTALELVLKIIKEKFNGQDR